jgi:hypothetical protein
MSRFLLIPLLILAFGGSALADDGQWLMSYYKAPKPDDIARLLPEWQKQGGFDQQKGQAATVGFLSRVMKDNPGKVRPWLEIAEAFPAADRHAMLIAAWYSAAPEAQAYFKENKLDEFAGKTPPDTSAFPVTHASILDFYWGAYFATGDASTIRNIIGALELSKDSGALDRYKTSEKTEADRQAAMNDAIYQAAMWSLTSNCKQDEKLFAICKDLLAPERLATTQRTFLAVALSKARPEQVKVEMHDGKFKVQISK